MPRSFVDSRGLQPVRASPILGPAGGGVGTNIVNDKGGIPMRTDFQIKNDVSEAILWDPTITSTSIVVAVSDGVVTLSGSVPYYSEKGAAEKATRHVSGVKAIAEELDVNLQGSHQRRDEDLAQSVVNALKWHVWVPHTVKATIEDRGCHGHSWTAEGFNPYAHRRSSVQQEAVSAPTSSTTKGAFP